MKGRRSIAFLAAVLTGWTSLCLVAGEPEAELSIARQALRDGLWAIAENHAEQALGGGTNLATSARLVMLEALAGAGNARGIPARIEAWGSPAGDGFRYWTAWALEKGGNYTAAAEKLADPIVDPNYATLAKRLQARLAAESGRPADAQRLFKELGAQLQGSDKISNAIEWARAMDHLGEGKAALEVLQSEGALSAVGADGDTARLLAADLHARAGETLLAIGQWQRLVSNGSNTTEQAFVTAASELSRVRFEAGATNAAVALAREALDRATQPDLRRLAGFRLGFELLSDAATRTNGIAVIKREVRADPERPEAREAQLRLADTLLELGDGETAAAEYNVFLETYPDASQDERVLEGRGWALLKLGKRTDSIGMFARAAKAATNGVDRARCEFKQADALLQDGKADEAALLYAGVAERNAGTPLAETALFNRGRALDAAGHRAEAAEVYGELMKLQGAHAADAALSYAAFAAISGHTDEALATYSKLIADGQAAPEKVLDARVGRGRTLYRAYRFSDAKADFEQVAASDPQRAASARFLVALCQYGLGRDVEAKALAEAVLADFPTSPLAPEISLWLAKLAYQRGDFAKASEGFETYSKRWEKAPHAVESLVWAARAASAVGNFARAIEFVSEAVKQGAEGKTLAEGLLVQAEALMELARFDEAAVVLERVAPKDSESHEALRAAILRADCLFALGADNDTRYEEALTAYRELLRASQLSPSDRLSVAFKIGRTLEKLGRTSEAMDQYYTNVVLAFRDARQQGTWYDERGRTFFARAAFTLADYFEGHGDFAQAEHVLALVATADVPAAAEAKSRIAKLNGRRSVL